LAVLDRGPSNLGKKRAMVLGGPCRILYLVSIGGPAAAKVIKADIHIDRGRRRRRGEGDPEELAVGHRSVASPLDG
jgi:hypothetical protein